MIDEITTRKKAQYELGEVKPEVRQVLNEVNIFREDLTPEPPQGPMVCSGSISLSREEMAFLSRSPRYMVRGDVSLSDVLLEGENLWQNTSLATWMETKTQ